MKKFRLLSFLILISAALLFSTSAFGAGNNTFKYSESYKDKVNNSFGPYELGKYMINAKINLEAGDVDKFNSDTCFDIDIEPADPESLNYGYSRYVCLDGDSSYWVEDVQSSYQEGDMGANMVYTGEDYFLGPHTPYVWVNLKWNTKKLKIKIKALTGVPDIEIPLLAFDYYWYYDPGTYWEPYVATVTVYNGSEDPFISKTFNFDVRANIRMKNNRTWGSLYQAKVNGNGYTY
jgi:hypothetical protein